MPPETFNNRLELLRLPLDRPTGGSGLTHLDILTVSIGDKDNVQGFGFSYALGIGGRVMYQAAEELLGIVATQYSLDPPPHPQDVWHTCKLAMNRVGRGAHYLALAAIDLAFWDLYARHLGLPLGEAMGGTLRPVNIYASGGVSPGHGYRRSRRYGGAGQRNRL